jgi:hypothetical protein
MGNRREGAIVPQAELPNRIKYRSEIKRQRRDFFIWKETRKMRSDFSLQENDSQTIFGQTVNGIQSFTASEWSMGKAKPVNHEEFCLKIKNKRANKNDSTSIG